MAALPRRTVVGLCATCTHVRTITTDRGSTFYQCRMAWKDERFAKYPVLPVLHCVGYIPAEPPPADATIAPDAPPPPEGTT